MMKIINLIGSPHGAKGNTARLLRMVSEGAESLGATTETIFLTGRNVLPCLGCDACHKTGKCVQKDEFEGIQEKILGADGLILGSPNYIFQVSAQMKAFMDRCCRAIHCLDFEGKYGVSVVTSGGGDEEPITEYMNHFMMITGMRPVGAVWATMGTIDAENFPADIRSQAIELGKNLVLSWEKKIVSAAVEERILAFRERMRSLMLWRKDEWPYEYQFWMQHRGLE
jgi:multimeric flavodoxin WrbA